MPKKNIYYQGLVIKNVDDNYKGGWNEKSCIKLIFQ
jgi:hypothetical protein